MPDVQSIVNSLAPFPSSGAKDTVTSAASTGFIPAYTAPGCGSTSNGFDTGAAIKGTLVKSAVGSIPFVGGFLNSLLGAFGGHHAAAVKTEQATLCEAVPAANQFLQGIDQLFETGQLDAATALSALDQGLQNWREMVRPILKDSGGKCNAACVYEKCFLACIAYRKQAYAARVPGNALTRGRINYLGTAPASAGGGVQSVLAQAGLTSAKQGRLAGLLLVAGAVLVGVLVVKLI